MIDIQVVNSPIDKKKILKSVKEVLQSKKVKETSLTISFVDEKTMRAIGKVYYKKDKKLHNVFSFVNSEVKGFVGDDSLGEILVCFDAIKDEKKALELINHSALHLLGIHHT